MLSSYPLLAYGVVVLFSLLIGSFLNVVIYRLPVMMQQAWARDCAELRGEPSPDTPPFNLAVPRSRCGTCGHMIGAWENIPIVSFLWLRGRCRACKTPLSWRYPAIELISALLALACLHIFGLSWQALFASVFAWVLLVLACIDFDTQLLPDSLTLPLLWLGLLFNAGLATIGFCSLQAAVYGAAIGYLSLWSVYWVFKLVTGKEGMGYGDFKLLAALGAWFGWQALPAIILLSSISGAIIGSLWLLLHRQGRDHPIPFGPFLACAGLLQLFFGPTLQYILSVFSPV
ncbi:prepilin peptidase [Parvibium lacunae]|uniref:Prepilin leader peptidase/N-methyltransferase n=1 Tax=Parvibium lacunae TaxID=1888893 RepID=A0A368L231_9BURK|nr:prepilin peptidase [Parvibium lacunae]